MKLCFIKTENMKAIFDSILLNSLQMEERTGEILIDCTVYEDSAIYDTQFVLSDTGMNCLLNELSCRDIELDFENGCDLIRLSDGTEVYRMDLTGSTVNPVFLPLYVMPQQLRLLRA